MITKTTPDGFIWLIIDADTAKAIFNDGNREIFALYNDDSEGEITKFEDIDFMESTGIPIGLQVGFIHSLTPVCPKCGKSLVPYKKNIIDGNVRNVKKSTMKVKLKVYCFNKIRIENESHSGFFYV